MSMCPECRGHLYRCKSCTEVFCSTCAQKGAGRYRKTAYGRCPTCGKSPIELLAKYQERIRNEEYKTRTADRADDSGYSKSSLSETVTGIGGRNIWVKLLKLLGAGIAWIVKALFSDNVDKRCFAFIIVVAVLWALFR